MKSEVWNISRLKAWDKNPRDITPEDLERLKTQIKKHEQYKPLVVAEDGTVLGGNMRLKAFKELGVTEVWVSIVHAPDEQTKVEIALSDNDRAGFYLEDKLKPLILAYPDLDLDAYHVDLGEQISLKDLFMDGEELDDKYSQNLGEVVYEPNQTNHKVSDLFEPEHKFDTEIDSLKNEEIKLMLKARTAYFGNFNFAKIADYYAYQATPEEQRLLEKLALVLLDKDKLIENGFSKIIESITDDEK